MDVQNMLAHHGKNNVWYGSRPNPEQSHRVIIILSMI